MCETLIGSYREVTLYTGVSLVGLRLGLFKVYGLLFEV